MKWTFAAKYAKILEQTEEKGQGSNEAIYYNIKNLYNKFYVQFC